MAFTQTIGYTSTLGGVTLTESKGYAASSSTSLEETVNNGQTDQEVVVAIDVSAVKAFYIVSDYAVTLETNSGSTPADTISLVADVPYVWTTDSYDTFQLGTDVTSFFFTNASGSNATIKMHTVIDATP
jgi:hypothetical protein